MIVYQSSQKEPTRECSYLPQQEAQHEYFLATDVGAEELEDFLANGWRKFGIYYFRPKCRLCNACQPLRVLTEEFKPSKSQRRVWKKNQQTRVVFKKLEYREEIFRVYLDHSIHRFSEVTTFEQFYTAHFQPSCPTFQGEYFIDDTLVAVSFLDRSSKGISSCYFVYLDDYKDYSLGTFSVLKEIEYAKSLKLPYYYLGYYIEQNHHMNYKNRFYPHEIYNWKEENWTKIEKKGLLPDGSNPIGQINEPDSHKNVLNSKG